MTPQRDSLTAIIVTTLVAAAIIAALLCLHLSFDPSTLRQPPRPTTGIIEAEEEFVELLNPRLPQDIVAGNPRPAQADIDAKANATPSPQTGMDISDSGTPSDAPQPKASNLESPVKAAPQPPKPSGPTQEQLRRQQEQEEARRRANNTAKSAFAKAADGKNNTKDPNKKPDGDSGTPQGTNPRANGTGTGTATGGWVVPRYAAVESTLTGSIRLRVRINPDGSVKSVQVVGGEPPAAANTALCNACIAEVSRHRFTRNDSAAPSEATATVTYRFK